MIFWENVQRRHSACVAGAGTIRPIRESVKNVETFKNDATELSCTSSPYLDRLEEVIE